MASNADMGVQQTGDETGEDKDYIHMRIPGEQLKTFKVIRETRREVTQEEGQVFWNERRGQYFKIRQDMTK